MTEQLKPCPFCEGVNVIHSGYRMYCHACGAEGPDADSADESAAIAAWNRRAQPAQAGAEPVAWMFQNEETGLTECVDVQQVEWGFEKNNPRWQKICPLYTHPPARVPLTAREVELMNGMIEVQLHHAQQCDSIANRPMAEKQKAWDMERVELLQKLLAAHGIGGGK